MNGGDNSDNENNIDKNDSQESVDSESFDDSNETSGLNSDDSEMWNVIPLNYFFYHT